MKVKEKEQKGKKKKEKKKLRGIPPSCYEYKYFG